MRARLPLLIFALSGRFIAQSAKRAGYEIRVADCFGDLDTRAVASRWLQLPPLSRLTAQQLRDSLLDLSAGEPCMLTCGSGIELFSPVLAQLPPRIRLVGNDAPTIDRVKQSERFFALLDELDLPYPVVLPARDSAPPGDWLLKSSRAFGGFHVRPAQNGAAADGDYIQQRIHGLCGSATFIADGQHARVLALNQQITEPGGFRLAHLLTPLSVSAAMETAIGNAVNKITAATGLAGLCSLDFIIDGDDRLYLLEINPRPGAAAELLGDAVDPFTVHLAACNGALPGARPAGRQAPCRMLSYLYAQRDLLVPEDMRWHAHCRDLSPPGSRIMAGEPVCTIITTASDSAGCLQQFDDIAGQMRSILEARA